LNEQATTTSEDLSYEQALEQFDARLRALEEGKLGLEDAMAAVEEARRYLKICEAKLDAARHKIEVRAEPAQEGEDNGPLALEEGRLL